MLGDIANYTDNISEIKNCKSFNKNANNKVIIV